MNIRFKAFVDSEDFCQGRKTINQSISLSAVLRCSSDVPPMFLWSPRVSKKKRPETSLTTNMFGESLCGFAWEPSSGSTNHQPREVQMRRPLRSLMMSSTHSLRRLFADGLGERLRGYCHADSSGGERGEAVLPLLARWGIQPVSHLRGKCSFVFKLLHWLDLTIIHLWRFLWKLKVNVMTTGRISSV